MNTLSPVNLDRLQEIVSLLICGDTDWFTANDIVIGNKGTHWILNYGQESKNEYNSLVRGLVVQKPSGAVANPLSLIKSFPFTRFFNHGESQAAKIDFANSEMIEKMDGTMVGVYFPYGIPQKPEFHTRKMMSTHEPDMQLTIRSFRGKKSVFLPVIQGYIQKLNFQEEDVHFTYIFEFIHEISAVITKYNPSQYGLYLLAGRDLRSYRELSKKELDQVAQRVGAYRPRHYDALADHDEIRRLFKVIAQETPDFEGTIFQDKITGERVKFKDKDYVEKHHMLDSTSFKRLIPLILKGEEEEILVYLPHVKEKVELFKTALSKYIEKAYQTILHWQAKGLRGRDLSVALYGENPLPKWQLRLQKADKPKPAESDPTLRNLILKCVNSGLDSEEAIKRMIYHELTALIAVGSRSPKPLMDIIGLSEGQYDEELEQVGDL